MPNILSDEANADASEIEVVGIGERPSLLQDATIITDDNKPI